MSFTKNILLLIVSPSYGWSVIKEHYTPANVMVSKVFLPLLAILASTTFLQLIYTNDTEIADCLLKVITDFSKFFFGYYLCSYILTGFFKELAFDYDSANKVNVAILYNIVILICINIIENCMPSPWTFIYVFYLYIFFISSKCNAYLDISPSSKFRFLIPGLALLIPFLIEWVLKITLF